MAADSSLRQKKIMKVSSVGIITNILLAVLKTVLGLASGSLAIVSDAVNNITDSSSSLITIIGTRMAQKKPDREHPFGHGRIEYLTSMIIGVIVLVTGVQLVISSVDGIRHPASLSYSVMTLVILAVTVCVKIALGMYTQRVGKKYNSGALQASGADAKNDALISAVTILSAVIYMLTDFSVDAFAGLLIAGFIIKTGYGVIRETIDKILGERGDKELADEIYKEVRENNEILGAHDLILNNYGPGSYMGSINVEVDAHRNVGEIHPILHDLQIKIFHTFKVYLVFGIYAIDVDSPVSRKVWEILSKFSETEPHCLGCHGIVADEACKKIFCDVILDFECDRSEIKNRVMEQIKREFQDYQITITIDNEFV